jgi:phage tail sheath gpL-like
MAIGFSTIPADLRVPLFYAEFDASMANSARAVQRTLLIGQATVASVPATLRYASSAEDVASLCGAGSMIARMMRAYRANDPIGEVWILPLQDAGAGVAATCTVTVTGPATAAGTIPLYVGGRLVLVGVTSGQAATAIATALAAAVNADARLPVTAAAASAVVTLTARHKGAVGNAIDVRHSYRGSAGGEALPAGVGLTITAMSGGTTDPDLSGLEALLGDEPFDFIAMPYTATGQLDAVAAVMNDTTGRWSYARQLYGHVFSAKADTAANLLTFGAARNDQHATILGVNASPTPPDEWAAAAMAAAAVSLRVDPARPLQTLGIAGVLAPAAGSRFTFSQQQSLLSAGIALPSFGADGSAMILRMVTTYQKNRFGQADNSYLDTETLFTLMEVIRRLRSVVTTKFARSKLADDGTRFGPGQPIVTPKGFKAELVAQYAAMEAEGLVEDADGFAAATIVERDANDRSRINVLYAPNLVNGLRVLAVLAQFRA